MFQPGNEFDDGSEDELAEPLLPPEDRLWRHPSEMALHGRPVSPEALDARRRWLSQTPSRTGALSAGLVGAVLATGVVLIGTHLTSWLSPSKPLSARALRLEIRSVVATTTTLASAVMPVTAPSVDVPLGRRVASGMALAEGWIDGRRHVVDDGIVVRSDGMIEVPASLAENAGGLQVTLAGGEFPAEVVGIDRATDLAVLHVNVKGLVPLRPAASSALVPGQWTTIEWLAPSEIVLSLGDVVSALPGVSEDGQDPSLFTELRTTASGLPAQPDGAAIIDGSGGLVGVVTDTRNGSLFMVPAPLAEQVATDLISDHRVDHGWLGIKGRPAAAGVKVVSVVRQSAAARAGIRPGDVIEAVNGRGVDTMGQLQARLYLMAPEKTVRLELERHGHQVGCTAVLQAAA